MSSVSVLRSKFELWGWKRTLSLGALAVAVPAAAHAVPPKVERQTLANGLEVLVVESHALPLVTVEIAAKNGSMTEPPEYSGLSHLYEHMFFKANKVLPTQEAYLARVRELGIEFNGTTQTERVNYFFTTTSDHLKDAMVFMRDAVLEPLFDAKEFERERHVVTGEIDRNESEPGYHLFHEASQRLWWKYPTRKDPLGSRKSVLAATVDKMRVIKERYYVPNNSVLVVTGDVMAPEIFAQARQLYAGWKTADDPFKKYPLVKHPALPKSEVVLVEQPVETVTGMFQWHGPSTVGSDVELTYAADLLGGATGEPSSKFQQHLVDSGACVGVNLSWFTQMNTGPISLGFEATPEKVDACIKAIQAELVAIKSADYLSDEEIKNAVHRYEVEQALQRERPSQLAHDLTFWWSSAGLDYYMTYVTKLAKVTRADMNRYLDTYVIGKPFVLSVMVSPDAAKKGLDRRHFEGVAGLQSAVAIAPGKRAARAVRSSEARQ